MDTIILLYKNEETFNVESIAIFGNLFWRTIDGGWNWINLNMLNHISQEISVTSSKTYF